MTDEGGKKGLIAVVLVLVVSLVVVFVLWQRDQESQDINIDFDTGDAGAVVEPAGQTRMLSRRGIRT